MMVEHSLYSLGKENRGGAGVVGTLCEEMMAAGYPVRAILILPMLGCCCCSSLCAPGGWGYLFNLPPIFVITSYFFPSSF